MLGAHLPAHERQDRIHRPMAIRDLIEHAENVEGPAAPPSFVLTLPCAPTEQKKRSRKELQPIQFFVVLQPVLEIGSHAPPVAVSRSVAYAFQSQSIPEMEVLPICQVVESLQDFDDLSLSSFALSVSSLV